MTATINLFTGEIDFINLKSYVDETLYQVNTNCSLIGDGLLYKIK